MGPLWSLYRWSVDVQRIVHALQLLVILIVAVADLLSLAACLPSSGKHRPSELPVSGTYLENRTPVSAAEILEQADGFELLALDPKHQLRSTTGNFYGYKVLRRADITDPKTRKLVSAFERGVAENQGTIAACFNPRHGIHVTRNGRPEDFVICFECLQVHSYGAVEEHFPDLEFAESTHLITCCASPEFPLRTE